LLADLMIFCPLGPIGPTNFKNSALANSLQTSHSYWPGHIVLPTSIIPK
jgi:hypothetical protein